MIRKQPLRRRIVIAFTLMTLAVSGVFSLGIVAIVHFVEEHLVSQEMGEELDEVIKHMKTTAELLSRTQTPEIKILRWLLKSVSIHPRTGRSKSARSY